MNYQQKKERFARDMARSINYRIVRKRYISTDKAHTKVMEFLSTNYKHQNIPIENIYNPVATIRKDKDFSKFVKKQTATMLKDQNQPYKVHSKPFIRDCIHLRGSAHIRTCTILDTIADSPYGKEFDALVKMVNKQVRVPNWFGGKDLQRYVLPKIKYVAHRDAIQIIPDDNNGLIRYTGAMIDQVNITNVVVKSNSHLQPIFAADGMIEEINIHNCTIDTKSEHKITIAGALRVTVSGNTTSDKVKIPVLLLPLRIGGGKLNIHILSFAQHSEHFYETARGFIQDHRSKPQRGTNLLNFNMEAYIEMYKQLKEELFKNKLPTTQQHISIAGKVIDNMLELGYCKLYDTWRK